ncbi:MAG: ABC transporter substrate binding protein [Myxococcaceae bacterium]
MLRRPALIACILVASFALAAGGERPRVVVVKSSSLTAYSQVVAGFAAEVRGQVEELTLEEGPEAPATFKKIAQAKPALVLAIGPAAAVGARREFTDVPVVFAMVPYYEKYELEGQNTTGIALTSDLSLELSALKAVQPKVKRVGVLEDPRYSKAFVDSASQAASARGLQLVPLEIDSPAKVDRVLGGAKGKVDALVIISDKTVGNAAVVERVLAFSVDEKVPAVGLAAAQVKQGALFSLSTAPLALGQQAGRIGNRILVEKVDPGAMAVANPEGLELWVNLSTAKKLGAPESFALDVVTFAARQGLTVKVVE